MESYVPGKLRERNTIDKDNEVIETMLLSAKGGQWENVWSILGEPENPKYDRFINIIPENRRWGTLHQAVYWNKPVILQKMLKYIACDSGTKVKQCTSECGSTTKMTALDIARAYKYPEMVNVLSKHQNKIEEQAVPTLQSYENYNTSEGLSLIALTLSAYKKTFHPQPIPTDKRIIDILEDIFKDIMKSDDRWQAVKEKVYDSAYVVSVDNANAIKGSASRQEFFQTVIKTYTIEENYMYTYLNLAFRRQKSQNYRPSGHDLALGPFAVVYQMLLLFWTDLPRENGITYRRMMLSNDDVQQYQIGTKFVWQSVASSSTDLAYAEPFPTCGTAGDQAVIFTIDNKENSPWQPRNIEKYAMYMERERTYPAGAKFEVTGRSKKKSDIHVSLKLLS
ncbi:hypothetical protein ACF0H5_022459 [Mactra antiquata]